MKKSVYSVVLSDEVISEIDRLAYRNNTNRSNMINQILAEYVSLTTPEKRISDIFDELANLLYSGENFRELAPPTTSVMSLRSALCYKYNPTVRYSVELYREAINGCQGEIRVSTRTTNSDLLYKMLEFYKFWSKVEAHYGFKGQNSYDSGVFKHPIMIRDSKYYSLNAKAYESTGNIIAEYISVFDKAMKLYFCDDDAGEKIPKMYLDFLSENEKTV